MWLGVEKQCTSHFCSNLLALYLSSRELTGSTVEEDSDKGDDTEEEGEKGKSTGIAMNVKGEAVGGMKGLRELRLQPAI